MRTSLRFLTAAALALAWACSVHPKTGPRLDRNLLTPEQFANHGYNTAYEVVEAMRSNWLTERGTDSFSIAGKVQVYFDGIRTRRRRDTSHGRPPPGDVHSASLTALPRRRAGVSITARGDLRLHPPDQRDGGPDASVSRSRRRRIDKRS
jgi:hypothetical protein